MEVKFNEFDRRSDGSYSVPEAARFTRMDGRVIRNWLKRTDPNRPKRDADTPFSFPENVVCFYDLIDLITVGELRKYGVALAVIGEANAYLSQMLGTNHPLSHRQLRKGPKGLFRELCRKVNSKQLQEVVRNDRFVKDLLAGRLSHVVYSRETEHADKWRIAPSVVIKPGVGGDMPTIEGTGKTTLLIASQYIANNKDVKLVGYLHDLTPEQVFAAYEFECEYGKFRRAA